MGKWVTAWGCAHRATHFTFWNQDSFSYTINNNLVGSKIRARFSNWYGYETCEIAKVQLTISDKHYDLTVNGKRNFEVRAGEDNDVWSDPIDAQIMTGNIVITIQFASTKRPQSGQTFMSPPGIVMILQALEVWCIQKTEVYAVLGDSITHWGKWTSPLIEEIYALQKGSLAFFEMAINGSRLLNGTNAQKKDTLGYSAQRRLKHDIMTTSGITHCILALGLNDLSMEEDSSDIPLTLSNYMRMVSKMCTQLHKQHIEVWGLTICPRFYDEVYTTEKDILRREINSWIMTDAPFDLSIDIASALRREEDAEPDNRYFCEDGCHINEKGGARIARLIKEYINR